MFKGSVSWDFSGSILACMDRLGLYKNLWLFLIFSVEPLILYLRLKLDAVNAKSKWLNNVLPHFSANQY